LENRDCVSKVANSCDSGAELPHPQGECKTTDVSTTLDDILSNLINEEVTVQCAVHGIVAIWKMP